MLQGGTYLVNSKYLIPKDGKTITYDTQILVNGEAPHYEVYLANVVGYAASQYDSYRGKFQFLFPALILLIYTFIDIKFPLFFFKLRNTVTIKKPEPSDFYISIQKIMWYINPIIGIVLMILAI